MTDTGGARQLRLIVEVEDYDAAVAFFRDALGLPEEAAFSGDGDERVMILDAGRATLELANPAHRRYVDQVEVGRPVAPRFRIALEVADVAAGTASAVAAGAEVLHEPRVWPEYHEHYYGAFVRDPDGNNVEAVSHRPE